MRLFLLILLNATHTGFANTVNREALLHQLASVQSALLDSKTNLKTSDQNLQTVETEFEKLKRLESEHVQLKADIQEQLKANANNEKGKSRQSFLFQAGKLDGEVERQIIEIRSRFIPLQNERTSWTERKNRYEGLVTDLSKKETQLQEQLSQTASPASGTAAAPTAVAPQESPTKSQP